MGLHPVVSKDILSIHNFSVSNLSLIINQLESIMPYLVQTIFVAHPESCLP